MKRRIWYLLAVILLLAATALFVVRSTEDKVTADMLSRAGRFAIPPGWTLTQEILRPERFLCISTNPCPSLYRSWDTGTELTDDDIRAVESGLGFTMTSNQTCTRQSNDIGNTPICISTGTDGEYEYWLTVVSPDPGEPQQVILVIRPEQLG